MRHTGMAESGPVLTVVVPVLNEARNIQAVLQSLQVFRERGQIEIVVVDGGSHDGTPRLTQPLCDRFIGSGKGRARQMNAGAALARGSHLLFLHADTLISENAMEQLLRRLAGSVVIWGRFNVAFQNRKIIYRVISGLMNVRSCLSGIATGDQGIFVKTSIFHRLGGYAEIPLMEDIELSRRLCRIQSPLCLRTRLYPSTRKWQREGVLKTIVLMWRLRLAYARGVSPEILVRRYYPE